MLNLITSNLKTDRGFQCSDTSSLAWAINRERCSSHVTNISDKKIFKLLHLRNSCLGKSDWY